VKKLIYQIDQTRLGYLEVREEEVEKLIRQIREQGGCIRKIKCPYELMESLQNKNSKGNSDH
jgi:hypothetical protein